MATILSSVVSRCSGAHCAAFVPALKLQAPFQLAFSRRERMLHTPCRAEDSSSQDEELMAVRAPLRWVGMYPALALSFPALATPAQKARGDCGVSLDFVLDTGANTNTINAAVAMELGLQQVGEAPGGSGAGGAIGGGATFFLGSCELGDLPKEEQFEFVSGLTASALPVAQPAAAGLLGVIFLDSFPGGVEFRWGERTVAGAGDVAGSDPSSVTFFGDAKGVQKMMEGLVRVELVNVHIQTLLHSAVCMLPCVKGVCI